MKHKNCQDCLYYDEFIDMDLTPCDEGGSENLHRCLSYKMGIPNGIWKGKTRCPYYIEPDE